MHTSRRKFINFYMMLIIMLCIGIISAQDISTQPFNNTTYDPDLHLFIDPDSIIESEGVVRFLNQPDKHPGPVLAGTWKPYRMTAAWGSVIREPDGKFRMWYLDFTGSHDMATRGVFGRGTDYGYYPQRPGDYRPEDLAFICYAESWDGIHWEKPPLGLFEFEESRENNIVCCGHEAANRTNWGLSNMDGCTVIRDDRESDPQKRYKMFAYWEGHHRYDNVVSNLGRPEEDIKRFNTYPGHYVHYSPDGIHWTYPVLSGIPYTHADRNTVGYDYKRNRWRAVVRPPKSIFKLRYGGGTVRAAAETTSDDQQHWTEPKLIMAPDEQDGNGSERQIHTFMPFNYGDMDLAILAVSDCRGGGNLAYLGYYDGGEDQWKRVFRDQPLIPPGGSGSFDRGGTVSTNNLPIIMGDQMYLYYTAHSTNKYHLAGARSIGLAIFRRDAFVGLRAGVIAPKWNWDPSGEATCLTRSMKVTGPNLQVNFEKLNDSGRIRVELLDENREVIPGYNLDDCEPVVLDGVRQPIKWKTKADLQELIDTKVHLRFSFVWGAVYAVKFDG